MTKTIEALAMTLGGLSLFAVCFLGFAMMSGTPLNEVPGVGKIFDVPDADTPEPEATPVERAPVRTDTEVVDAGLGVLGAWSLPSPYTPAELRTLTEEIKGKLHQLEAKEARITERETQVSLDLEVLAERFEGLERLRAELEAYEDELNLREQELDYKSESVEGNQNAAWADVAVVLEGQDPKAAAMHLTEYAPDEAARILRAMNPDTAVELLNSIEGPGWKEYVDAYTRTRPVPGRSRRN